MVDLPTLITVLIAFGIFQLYFFVCIVTAIIDLTKKEIYWTKRALVIGGRLFYLFSFSLFGMTVLTKSQNPLPTQIAINSFALFSLVTLVLDLFSHKSTWTKRLLIAGGVLFYILSLVSTVNTLK